MGFAALNPPYELAHSTLLNLAKRPKEWTSARLARYLSIFIWGAVYGLDRDFEMLDVAS
jgi:hypothetical protein